MTNLPGLIACISVVMLLPSARGEPEHSGGLLSLEVGSVEVQVAPNGEFSAVSLNAKVTPLDVPDDEKWSGPFWSWTAAGTARMLVDHKHAASPAATLRVLHLPSGSATITITATATWQAGRKRLSRSSSQQLAIKAKGLPRLQYFQPSDQGGNFVDIVGPLFLLEGEELELKAVPRFGNAELMANEIAWSGSAGATGTGAVKRIAGKRVSQTTADVQSVTATYGTFSVTVGVIVYRISPTTTADNNFPGRDPNAFGGGEVVNLMCAIFPEGLTARDIGGLVWEIEDGGGDLLTNGSGVGEFVCGLGAEDRKIELSVKIPRGPMRKKKPPGEVPGAPSHKGKH